MAKLTSRPTGGLNMGHLSKQVYEVRAFVPIGGILRQTGAIAKWEDGRVVRFPPARPRQDNVGMRNEHGQAIGDPVPGWTAPPRPPPNPLQGRYCRVERLTSAHGPDLHRANREAPDGRYWTYLPYGPFETEGEYLAWLGRSCLGEDPLFHTVFDAATGRASGVASYLRIAPEAGSIEVGHINFAPALQRTPAATEAMYLMMRRAFELGYRRYEWKCDALNAPSRRAAQRLGLSYEGVFRQATVYKGRNRDTAWYAAIDHEWPALARAFEQWLAPGNFDGEGRQRVSLSDLTRPLLVAVG
jgi:RimJ/RimL family protein N-acetyltransferase